MREGCNAFRNRIGSQLLERLGAATTTILDRSSPEGRFDLLDRGRRGNSTVFIGQNGVIIVDAKTTPEGGKQLVAEISKLTPKRITHVILTHSDSDHVNGLAGFPDGLTIIAHQNNKNEQEAALKSGGRGAPPANRLPTQVVSKDKETMKIDGVNVTLLHWAPAHTSGDLVFSLIKD